MRIDEADHWIYRTGPRFTVTGSKHSGSHSNLNLWQMRAIGKSGLPIADG